MSDIRQPLIDDFLEEMNKIINDNKNRIVKHAKKNPDELEDLPKSVENKIMSLYENLMDDLAEQLVEKANDELNQDNKSGGWEDALFTNTVLVGIYYSTQTMRDNFHKIHSAQVARQITNDAIKELPEDSTKKEIDTAIEDAHNEAVDNAVESSKSSIESLTVSEVGFSYYLLAKAETFTRGLNHYRWRTQGDSRVRPTHASKDGTIRKWGVGEEVGESFGCRCYSEFVTAEEVAEAGL